MEELLKRYCASHLVWAIIVIVDPQVLGFEGMIQRFEVTAISMYVCMYVAYEILLKNTVPLLLGCLQHIGW